MNSYWNAFTAIFLRDIILASRYRAELANPLIFFIMVIVLFPFAFGSDPDLLRRVTAGMI
ncbi:MAG: heme exporter protein CcmB, partial [Proteobacteria bacterium]|nr:heme exporter protein CcmB [Pseudomonadota bacterium]